MVIVVSRYRRFQGQQSIPNCYTGHGLFEEWLHRRSGAEIIAAWKRDVTGFRLRPESPEIEELEQDVMDLARKVPQAAGYCFSSADLRSRTPCAGKTEAGVPLILGCVSKRW
jgi:hypothetical protein